MNSQSDGRACQRGQPRWTRLLTLLLSLLMAPIVLAQPATFPDKTLNMVVNFGSGGVTDLMSRELARGMEADLGTSVVVFNRPGALGTLGPGYVAKQAADGYILAVVSASVITITPHLMDVPFGLDDLTFVAGYGKNRFGLVVKADSPYQTIDDLVSAARGGKSLFFGSPSTSNSVVIFDLGSKSKSKFELISYKSGPDTTMGLLTGQVAVIAPNPPDVMSHLKAGTVRLLASASPARWPEFPNVPTLKESGYDVALEAWVGIAVPKATPSAVVARLEKSIQMAMSQPAIATSFLKIGADPAFMDGKAYTEFLKKEREVMGRLIKESGIPRIQ
ncbi:MAG: ABC transporter substrate-binding protein [Alcaligenaceae bacterium]|nr:MAG: ABC transporter substrate-binding protein [Alcaligenaceae bacterium]